MDYITQLAAFQQSHDTAEPQENIDLSPFVRNGEQLLSADIPEPEILISPFLARGTVTLIVGATKIGKTWAALDLACSLASGTPFLNYRVPNPASVLYLDGELGPSQLQLRAHKISPSNNALFLNSAEISQGTSQSLNLTNAQHQEAVDRILSAHEPAALVIDNMTALAPRKSEDDNADPNLLQFKRWCMRLKARGIAVVIIHHTGHDGRRSRGASALPDFVDTVIHLSSIDDVHRLVKLAFVSTRDRRPDPDSVIFKIVDEGDVISLDPVSLSRTTPEYALLPLLLDGHHSTQKSLATSVCKSPGTVSAWIKKLRKAGLLPRRGLNLTEKGQQMASSNA